MLGLLLGGLIGGAVGAGGGLLLRHTRRRGWSSEEFAGPAVLMLAILAYVGALLVGANGFVAAFIGGIAFGACAGRGGPQEVYYVEQTCGLSSMVAWLLFGALAVPTLAGSVSGPMILYAVLSLTIIRMLPVALGLLGSHLDGMTVAFIGWFGPRGLASVVFALITLEELEGARGPVNTVVGTICLTVLLSVLAHGLTARPLAGRYGANRTDQPSTNETEPILRSFVGNRSEGGMATGRRR